MSRQSCSELLQEFRKGPEPLATAKLQFLGVEGKDVYNISAPFWLRGEEILAGRVEARDSEWAETVFFGRTPQGWNPLTDAPRFSLQDPFVTWIHGYLIVGGVEVFPRPDNPNALGWRTRFFRGTDLQDLQPFAVGPDGMKDIRLHGTAEGRIAIFTRPQGTPGGRGTIGYIEVDSLDQVNTDTINQAVLWEQFLPEEWGGANEIHTLPNGWLGVLGHIARFDAEGDRHYYPMVFGWHSGQQRLTPMRIIAERRLFTPGAAKRPDLVDVIFSGGLRRHDDGTAHFYAGVSDAEAHVMLIRDPFLQLDMFVNSRR